MRLKTEEKRREIIEVASEVFRAKGFAAASMAEISGRLGGSKGTLYSYFTSKEELFSAVMLAMGRKLAGPVFSELEHVRDVRSAIPRFAQRLVRVLASPEALAFMRMIAAEGARSGIGRLCFESGRGLYKRKFEDFFRRQVAAGSFREADPVQAAMHIEGLCAGGPVRDLLEGVVDSVSGEELVAAADPAIDGRALRMCWSQ